MKTAENWRGDDAVAVANPMARRHRREVGRIRNTGPEPRVWTPTLARLGTCERQRIQGTSSLRRAPRAGRTPGCGRRRSTIPRLPTVGLARLGPETRRMDFSIATRSDDYWSRRCRLSTRACSRGQVAWRQHDGGHTDGPNWRYFSRGPTGFSSEAWTRRPLARR